MSQIIISSSPDKAATCLYGDNSLYPKLQEFFVNSPLDDNRPLIQIEESLFIIFDRKETIQGLNVDNTKDLLLYHHESHHTFKLEISNRLYENHSNAMGNAYYKFYKILFDDTITDKYAEVKKEVFGGLTKKDMIYIIGEIGGKIYNGIMDEDELREAMGTLIDDKIEAAISYLAAHQKPQAELKQASPEERKTIFEKQSIILNALNKLKQNGK